MAAQPQQINKQHVRLKSHLNAIGDLIHESRFNFITARNKGIRNFLLTGTTLGSLLFVGAGLAPYYKQLPEESRLYAGEMNAKFNKDAVIVKGGFAISIKRTMHFFENVFNVLANHPSLESIATQAKNAYQQNPSATLKWSGGALLVSAVVGMFSFFRTRYKLDQQNHRAIGQNLKSAMEQLKKEPKLQAEIDGNEIVREWASKIEEPPALSGLKEEVLASLGSVR